MRKIVQRAILIALSVLFLIASCTSSNSTKTEEKTAEKTIPVATGPEFGEWLAKFVADIHSGDKARQRKAAIDFSPTPDEYRYVFPKNGERVAKLAEDGMAKTTDAEIESFVEILIQDYGGKTGKVKLLGIRDVRKEPNEFDSGKKAQAIEEMRPEFPLVEPKMTGGGFAYFMRINGRWVFLSNFEWLFPKD